MSILTLCTNKTCEIKKRCRRYTGEPNKYQSYFSPPGGKDCEYFIENTMNDMVSIYNIGRKRKD